MNHAFDHALLPRGPGGIGKEVFDDRKAFLLDRLRRHGCCGTEPSRFSLPLNGVANPALEHGNHTKIESKWFGDLHAEAGELFAERFHLLRYILTNVVPRKEQVGRNNDPSVSLLMKIPD